jgi:hypothetical protein
MIKSLQQYCNTCCCCSLNGDISLMLLLLLNWSQFMTVVTHSSKQQLYAALDLTSSWSWGS